MATLVAYFLAPAWWFGSAATGYAAAKLLLVLAMTATIFPAYGLARLVVPRWYALAAATGATVVPALAYSPILVEEPLAYPLSTTALWLIARVYAEPSWGRAGLAVLACTAAFLTRTQLSILFPLFALGPRLARLAVGARAAVALVVERLGLGRARDAARRLRGRHLGRDRAPVEELARHDRLLPRADPRARVVGAGRARDRDRRAAGDRGRRRARAAAARAARSQDARVRRDERRRARVFIAYAGIKGAYISVTFSTLVVERNLIYLCPILFASTALALARGVGRGWAIAGATLFTLYVVQEVPLRLDNYPYYEAHGLSMPHFLNREWGWPEGRIENAMLVVCFVALGVLIALRLLRRGSRAFTAVAASAAVAVFAWSLTTEVYAAEGERKHARQLESGLIVPHDWVDRLTGGGSVVVLGQQMGGDPNEIYLTEFFNQSIKKMWSTDGTAPGPGAILTPDLAAADGTLTPNPETEYALTLNGVELQAPVVARVGRFVLYDVDRQPLKISAAVTGVYADGWMSDEAAYNRFDVSRDGPGFATVDLSRVGFCGGAPTSKATVRVGTIGIGPDNQPAIDQVTGVRRSCSRTARRSGSGWACRAAPWRLEVTIDPTFVPHDIDVNHQDRRELGATITAGFRGFTPGG